jgi:hypothetical protein
MKDFIQINKFSELHDGKNIIFCKTDFIIEEFDYIKKLNSDIILITGNSDYAITDNLVSLLPKNVKKWYAQNALSMNPILEPLPIGLENKLPSLRDGHGIGYYDRSKQKEELLSRNIKPPKEKFIYSNFNINTNYNERIKYKNLSINLEHIDWEENNLTITEYFNKILKYKMVLCPIGNGVDTHRLWEVLYSNVIPITVKVGDFKIYNLYEKLPILVLNSFEDLKNKNLIEEEYNKIINKKCNLEYLDYEFWKKNLILT